MWHPENVEASSKLADFTMQMRNLSPIHQPEIITGEFAAFAGKVLS